MFVIVHTITMTVGDLELCANLYHSLTLPTSNRIKMCLLGKQFAVKRLNKSFCIRDMFNNHLNSQPQLKHRFRAVNMKQATLAHRVQPHIAAVKKNKCRPIVSSTNVPKEEPAPTQEITSPPDSPIQIDTGGCPRADWGPTETSVWLQANRYTGHLHHNLSSYSGADLLRLSREDLIQLCGLSDGIRLYNALHVRAVAPKLTMYVCIDPRDRVYHVVYLSCLSPAELLRKICFAIGISASQVTALYFVGPSDIKLLPTEELVSHLPDHTAYTIQLIADGQEKYQMLLKQSEAASIPSP